MRNFVMAILLGGALLMGATGTMAQSGNKSYDSWREQISRLQTGRSTPVEETATYSAFKTVVPANAWFDQVFQMKTGRNTPAEEARQAEEAANSKIRHNFTTGSAPAMSATWHGQMFRAKTGRQCPLEAALSGE